MAYPDRGPFVCRLGSGLPHPARTRSRVSSASCRDRSGIPSITGARARAADSAASGHENSTGAGRLCSRLQTETASVAPVPAKYRHLPMPPDSRVEGDPVKARILALAVEKTGYPQDMLDLDLDLEADLGVDTVKQAEMFAAIREIYNIPRDENRKSRDYPTLAHVIRFVYEKRPDLAGATPLAAVSSAGRKKSKSRHQHLWRFLPKAAPMRR